MPCTEESAARTSGMSAYPLDDKLQYLAPDYSERTYPEEKGKIPTCGYELYIGQLRRWVESGRAGAKVAAVYRYVLKGSIIDDLIGQGVIRRFLTSYYLPSWIVDKPIKKGILVEGLGSSLDPSADAKDSDDLYKLGKQSQFFVRWRVDIPNDPVKETWKDAQIRQDWIDYCLSMKNEEGLCYISGKSGPISNLAPAKIRNNGDKAKLISSKNSNQMSYLGRFEKPDQAFNVNVVVSQQAHNALRWLIARQGYHEGDLCIVTWGLNSNVINPFSVDYGLFEVKLDPLADMNVSKHINDRLRGYDSKINTDKVMIMALSSATTGRMSILMFREMLGKDFIERLDRWFIPMTWKHSFGFRNLENGKSERFPFVGAPCPRDIAKVAYGENADGKIITNTVERLIPCIIDGLPVPKDIVDAAVRRASNPMAFDKRYLWDKAVTVACSLYKKHSGVDYSMSLDRERKSRDYLYGRLLAVADLLEGSALRDAGEDRQTNAQRLMQRFSEFPYATWSTIELSLKPYEARLGKKARYYESEMDSIMDLFDVDDYMDNRKLSGEFLIGYHCQKEYHYNKNKKTEQEE